METKPFWLKPSDFNIQIKMAAFLFSVTLIWVSLLLFARFQLMENPRWLTLCELNPTLFACYFRAVMGQSIHWNLLGWGSLTTVVSSILLRRYSPKLSTALMLIGWAWSLGALIFYNADVGVIAFICSFMYGCSIVINDQLSSKKLGET